eukprot:4369792-Pyramimonas_sp.AAC.1
MAGDFPAWRETHPLCYPVSIIYFCVSVAGVARVGGAGRVGVVRVSPGISGLGGARCVGKD